MFNDFTIFQIVISFAIMFLGGLVQSTIGFGMGLVSGPLLLEAGFGLLETVVILVVSASLQCAYSTYKLRENIPFRPVFTLTPLRILGMIAGVALLHRFSSLDKESVKQIVGLVLLFAVIAQSYALYRGRCEVRVPKIFTAGAFILSGIMAGFCGMGGPPLVLWVNCQSWNSLKMRGFLQSCFAFANPFQLLLICVMKYSELIPPAILLAMICFPIVIVSSKLGLKIGEKIHADRLRKYALGTLAILAFMNILRPILAA